MLIRMAVWQWLRRSFIHDGICRSIFDTWPRSIRLAVPLGMISLPSGLRDHWRSLQQRLS